MRIRPVVTALLLAGALLPRTGAAPRTEEAPPEIAQRPDVTFTPRAVRIELDLTLDPSNGTLVERAAVTVEGKGPSTLVFAPVPDKSQYREQEVVDAFAAAALATDPTSNWRHPPSLRAPNGVLEDTFMQATGRPIWNASSIYAPTLVIAGEFDTWSFAEDRNGLMRDLTNAPVKKQVLINDATHFVLFDQKRFEFFDENHRFLKQ